MGSPAALPCHVTLRPRCCVCPPTSSSWPACRSVRLHRHAVAGRKPAQPGPSAAAALHGVCMCLLHGGRTAVAAAEARRREAAMAHRRAEVKPVMKPHGGRSAVAEGHWQGHAHAVLHLKAWHRLRLHGARQPCDSHPTGSEHVLCPAPAARICYDLKWAASRAHAGCPLGTASLPAAGRSSLGPAGQRGPEMAGSQTIAAPCSMNEQRGIKGVNLLGAKCVHPAHLPSRRPSCVEQAATPGADKQPAAG